MQQELILILTQFGGGPGDPGNNVVRFLLAGFFWGVLFFVSYRFWQTTTDRRHLYFSIAAAIGFCRELFMFICEYGSFRGYFPFSTVFRHYPPLEHSADLMSNLLLGYAFLRFYFNFERFSRFYLIISSSLSIGAYLVIAPLWRRFLDAQLQVTLDGGAFIGAQFHDFPGDLAYRILGVLVTLPVLGAFLYARSRRVRIPWLAFVAFVCFFLDHGLQAINDLAHDRYAPVLAPLRHCLHTLALIQLVGVYWWEVTRQLRNRHQFLQSMLDTIPDLIYYKDVNNMYQGCNRNFGDNLLSGAQNRITGCSDMDIFRDQEVALRRAGEDRELMLGNCPATFEQTYTLASGRQAVFETIKTPYHDLEGRVAGLIGISRDITARKHTEEELRQKNAELERFVYTLSHDLKSPLVTISVFLEYLEQDVAAGDGLRVREDFNYIRTATAKMKRLLDELLELSRIGLVVANLEDVPFQDIVQETVEVLAGRIHERGVCVSIGECNPVLYGERARLNEIWQNLVENAVKYMGSQPEPHIQIGLEDDSGETVFFVRDNGIGIDSKFHDNIFGLFNKLDADSDGSGLGLTLVKRIVEMYGGRIWVESEGDGTGACFRLTLPKAVKGAG